MAITKRTEEDKIEVVGEFKHIQVRTATILEEDGVELSRSYHRHIVTPNATADELAAQSAEVQAISAAVHSDAVKTAYAAHVAANALDEE